MTTLDPLSRKIQVVAQATICYFSEDPAHPIEHPFDGGSARGATRRLAAQHGKTQEILLEFDAAQKPFLD